MSRSVLLGLLVSWKCTPGKVDVVKCTPGIIGVVEVYSGEG